MAAIQKLSVKILHRLPPQSRLQSTAATSDPLSPPAANIEEENAGADADETVFDATIGGDQVAYTGMDDIADETRVGDDDGDKRAAEEGDAPEEEDLHGADADNTAGDDGEESTDPNGNGDDDEHDDDTPPPPAPPFTHFPSPTHHTTTSPQTPFPTPILPPSPLLTHTSPVFPSSTPTTTHQSIAIFPPA